MKLWVGTVRKLAAAVRRRGQEFDGGASAALDSFVSRAKIIIRQVLIPRRFQSREQTVSRLITLRVCSQKFVEVGRIQLNHRDQKSMVESSAAVQRSGTEQ